jgi:hypothetical protein
MAREVVETVGFWGAPIATRLVRAATATTRTIDPVFIEQFPSKIARVGRSQFNTPSPRQAHPAGTNGFGSPKTVESWTQFVSSSAVVDSVQS